jgi:RNA polymerase sigma factor (sigma-70 family)
VLSCIQIRLAGRHMVEGDDAKQFAAVVMPFLSDALTMALWLTGDRADAEDIVQEACLRAFRSIATFAGGSARAWVLTIVRNTAFTWLQKNRPVEIVALDQLETEERVQAERGGVLDDAMSANPEAEMIARTDTAHLHAEIEKLPLEFRTVIVLRDIQGLDYREIAEVTSVPIGTVMSRLSRARRRLIGAIAQNGGRTVPKKVTSILAAKGKAGAAKN